MPNNHNTEFMTAKELRERIAQIEKELRKVTYSGSGSAWGALAGAGLGALIPGIGMLIGAAATATGMGLAASFLKRKRELEKELEELKNRLEILETDGSANKRGQRRSDG
jgi:hypothetical protein